MRIVGVDLGTRRLAAACVETLFVWSMDLDNAAGRRQFPAEFDAGQALGLLLVEALRHHGGPDIPTLFIAERPLVHHQRPNIRTAVGMSISAGAALSPLPGQVALLDSPSMWKKELCGNGHADKAEVRAAVEAREPTLATLCAEDENRFDAAGIAIGGARLAQDGRL